MNYWFAFVLDNDNIFIIIFRYHVPRSWLKPSGNFLVLLEELGGDPTGISLVKRFRKTVCADISDDQETLKNWHRVKSETIYRPKAHLKCLPGQKISKIKFASYGQPQGACGNYKKGSCHANISYDAAKRVIQLFHIYLLIESFTLMNSKPLYNYWKFSLVLRFLQTPQETRLFKTKNIIYGVELCRLKFHVEHKIWCIK